MEYVIRINFEGVLLDSTAYLDHVVLIISCMKHFCFVFSGSNTLLIYSVIIHLQKGF